VEIPFICVYSHGYLPGFGLSFGIDFGKTQQGWLCNIVYFYFAHVDELFA